MALIDTVSCHEEQSSELSPLGKEKVMASFILSISSCAFMSSSVKWRDAGRSLDFLFCRGIRGGRGQRSDMSQLWNPDHSGSPNSSPPLHPTHTHTHRETYSHPQVSCKSHEMLQKYPLPAHPEEDIHPPFSREIECLSPYLAAMTTN